MMLDFFQTIIFSFAALFPVLNPIGSSIIILSIVEGASSQELNTLAYKIALYTAVMLVVALFTGSWILRIFGITVPIVLIGGGFILAFIGWQLLNKPAETHHQDIKAIHDADQANFNSMTFYPLTMPVTAGPGCIAVVIALGAHSLRPNLSQTFYYQSATALGILLVATVIYLCYRYAHVITRKLGASGTEVIMRLAAFFNVCIGLQLMWHGTETLIKSV